MTQYAQSDGGEQALEVRNASHSTMDRIVTGTFYLSAFLAIVTVSGALYAVFSS